MRKKPPTDFKIQKIEKKCFMNNGKRILSFLITLFISQITDIMASEFQSIKKMKNKDPLFGQIILEKNVEEVISESDTDENLIFKNIMDIALDSKENIYLLDIEKVLMFSRDGKFMRTIGRIGQGPGEFISPCKLFIDDADNLYINDQGQALSVFDNSGEFFGLIRFKFTLPMFPDNLKRFFIDKNGTIIAIRYYFDDKGLRHVCIRSDRNGEIVNNIIDVEQKGIRICGSAGGGVMAGNIHPYSRGIYFCFLKKEGMICLGENTAYALHIFDLEGKENIIFGKEEKTQPVTKSEFDYLGLGKDDEIPAHRPFFKDIFSDDKERIYIIRVMPIIEKEMMQEIDIFSRDGRYLYKIKTPFCPKAIKNGRFYTFMRDEEGRTIVSRIKIPEYNRLKY